MSITFAGVGLSQKIMAFEAGKELALSLLVDMNNQKPDLVLLFSTIHYKNYGGFKQLLDGIYSQLPKETKLIGGTTAGFIIPKGCFTRGVAAFGIKSDEID